MVFRSHGTSEHRIISVKLDLFISSSSEVKLTNGERRSVENVNFRSRLSPIEEQVPHLQSSK